MPKRIEMFCIRRYKWLNSTRFAKCLPSPTPYELEARPLRFFGRVLRSLFGG